MAGWLPLVSRLTPELLDVCLSYRFYVHTGLLEVLRKLVVYFKTRNLIK